MTVAEFLRNIEDARTSDAPISLSLVAIREIDRPVSLSGHATVHASIMALFCVHWEKFGPPQHLLMGSRKPPPLLHALYEIITRYTQKQGMHQIWTHLFDNCESEEEGTRNADAECFGKLRLTTPCKFRPEPRPVCDQDRRRSIRRTSDSAFKHTFTDNTRSYDDDLFASSDCRVLALIKDQDFDTRRLSLSTRDAAAHSNP